MIKSISFDFLRVTYHLLVTLPYAFGDYLPSPVLRHCTRPNKGVVGMPELYNQTPYEKYFC